jgi:hypothetical protein
MPPALGDVRRESPDLPFSEGSANLFGLLKAEPNCSCGLGELLSMTTHPIHESQLLE